VPTTTLEPENRSIEDVERYRTFPWFPWLSLTLERPCTCTVDSYL